MSRAASLLVRGPAGALEVIVESGDGVERTQERPLVALIAHPHPLYGGTMENKVATTLSRMYRQLGIDAVRFNFRGVGASDGVHDEGRGEVDDMLAVAAYVLERQPEAQLIFAGFSFGSAIAAAASEVVAAGVGSTGILPCQHLVLVAPPVDRYTYAPKGEFACPTCIAIGGVDEIVDANLVTDWVKGMSSPPRLVCIPEASHFFHGELVSLKTQLEREVRAMLSEV